MVRGRLAQEDEELGDVVGIHRSRPSQNHGVTAHPEELAAEVVVAGAFERHGERLSGVRFDLRRVGHAMVFAIGPVVINSAIDRKAFAVAVSHGQNDLGEFREVPGAAGRAEGHPGPGSLVAGGDLERRAAL